MSKKFFLILFFYYTITRAKIKLVQSIKWNVPSECNFQQIFNPITQKCINCNNKMLVANKDKSECICGSSYVPNLTQNYNTKNLKQECIKCSDLCKIK